MKNYSYEIAAAKTNHFVTNGLFGANIVFSAANLKEGGVGDSFDVLGFDYVRYPGGSITEQSFDIRNPDKAIVPGNYESGDFQTVNEDYLKYSEFMKWAGDEKMSVVFVVPTHNIISREARNYGNLDSTEIDATVKFVKEMLDPKGPYGKTKIDTLELGNEYWGSGRMTSEQYGKVANALLPKLKKVINDHGLNVKLGVQSGEPWGPDFKEGGKFFGTKWSEVYKVSTKDIVNQLSTESKSAIDVVIRHHYEKGDDRPDMKGFTDAKPIWTKAGVDVPFSVTEWNINQKQASDDVGGLKSASAIMELHQNLVELDLDSAIAWPAKLGGRFSLTKNNDGNELKFSGAMLTMLHDTLIGAELMNTDTPNETGVEVNAWRLKDGGSAVYVASQVEERGKFTIDASSLTGNGTVKGVRILSLDPATADGKDWSNSQDKYVTGVDAWEDNGASPVITEYSGKDIVSKDGLITLELNPFEVAEVVFEPPHVVSEPLPPVEKPVDNDDPTEVEDPQDEDTASGGGCFVATAAYGTRNHPDVVSLRHFRDNHLVKVWAGRAFIRFYWVLGPKMAKRVSSDSRVSSILRFGLSRLVSFGKTLAK